MKRIIVSGAGGFLGSNIVAKALDHNIEVVAITSKEGDNSQIEKINTSEFLTKGYKFRADDAFINCLFPTNADGYKMAAGLDKVFKIISNVYSSGCGTFINISSQSVYSSVRKNPATETDLLCLDTPYAVGKYSSEMFTNEIFRDRRHTNIRMASLLGVGYDQRILNRMVDQALKGEKIKVVGGMQRYGFLDVRDAAAAIVKLSMDCSESWKETYNVGRNESYSLIDVAECICCEIKEKTGKKAEYIVINGQDNRNSSLDSSRFMTEFCWKPEIGLKKTTDDIIMSKSALSEKKANEDLDNRKRIPNHFKQDVGVI